MPVFCGEFASEHQRVVVVLSTPYATALLASLLRSVHTWETASGPEGCGGRGEGTGTPAGFCEHLRTWLKEDGFGVTEAAALLPPLIGERASLRPQRHGPRPNELFAVARLSNLGQVVRHRGRRRLEDRRAKLAADADW